MESLVPATVASMKEHALSTALRPFSRAPQHLFQLGSAQVMGVVSRVRVPATVSRATLEKPVESVMLLRATWSLPRKSGESYGLMLMAPLPLTRGARPLHQQGCVSLFPHPLARKLHAEYLSTITVDIKPNSQRSIVQWQ